MFRNSGSSDDFYGLPRNVDLHSILILVSHTCNNWPGEARAEVMRYKTSTPPTNVARCRSHTEGNTKHCKRHHLLEVQKNMPELAAIETLAQSEISISQF